MSNRCRIAVIVAGTVLTVPASASFDMMLLPDTNTNRVVRFDPNNRVALGSFGDFGVPAGVKYVTVGSNGRAYLSSAFGSTIWNYNTGLTMGAFGQPNDKISMSPNGNRLFEGFSNFVNTYNSNLTVQSSTWTPFVNNTVVAASDTRALAFAWSSESNRVAVSAFSSVTGQGASTFAGFGVVNGSIGSSQASVSGDSAQAVVSYVDGIGIRWIVRSSLNLGTGAILATEQVLLQSGSFAENANVMVMPGHGGWWVVGDDFSSENITRISFYGSNFAWGYSYTTTAVNVPRVGWGGHNIVAPEPGTLIALGAGALTMIRRRRAKSS